MLSNLTLLHELFNVVRKIVLESGGDGDAWIVSPRYEAYAAEFKIYEDTMTVPYFITQYDNEGSIQFSNNQESICFIGNRAGLPSWTCDIVIEIL